MGDRLTLSEVETIVSRCRFRDRVFRVIEKGDGFLIQLRYLESDVEVPGSKPVLQSSRKWYVSGYSTLSEVVETVWACVCRSQIHVASEHFMYNGERVFSQHFDVEARLAACRIGGFDKRPSP